MKMSKSDSLLIVKYHYNLNIPINGRMVPLMEAHKSGKALLRLLETAYQLAWVCSAPAWQADAMVFASQPVRGESVKQPDTEASTLHPDPFNNHCHATEKTAVMKRQALRSGRSEFKSWLMISLWHWASLLLSLCSNILISVMGGNLVLAQRVSSPKPLAQDLTHNKHSRTLQYWGYASCLVPDLGKEGYFTIRMMVAVNWSQVPLVSLNNSPSICSLLGDFYCVWVLNFGGKMFFYIYQRDRMFFLLSPVNMVNYIDWNFHFWDKFYFVIILFIEMD